MPYIVASNRIEGLTQIKALVGIFGKKKKEFSNPVYNETSLRTDFLSPFLKSFGWDVDNDNGKSQFFRDVVQEESIEIREDGSKKNPDYSLRIQGLRKLFVEAKKPSVDILSSAKSSFQLRRYGWNANLGLSILTNFDQLILYDCRYRPDIEENEHIARFRVWNFSEYVTAFDEIYNIISYESVASGTLDDLFSLYDREGQTFDHYFLHQIENWRRQQAQSAVLENPSLNKENINFLIQRLLNRIIFLRICEDSVLTP